MSFLDEVRAKRQKLADVLSDEDYSGIREIVEELYPDKAHFIYELLQNAEDKGATEVSFALNDDSLTFEHNGRPFDKDDVWGITNIGKGTKKDQDDKIGRFGVGFKAVFAYSETPFIWSPTFSFKISDLVLPKEIKAEPLFGDITRFKFPFNNPKKPAATAYDEVKVGLASLAETTLLFLSNIKSIRWQVGQSSSGEIRRVLHSENHVEVLKERGDTIIASSHFLCFSESVESLPRQSVSIAFAMGYLPNATSFNRQKKLSRQLKIVPANPGRVAVFFPAENEKSGLRFHLHGPFVPELSRASIKETDANKPLFEQLVKLAARSLHIIRDLNLLSGEFLGVLPNPRETISERYQPIRTAIINEMNNQPLTPTHTKSYAPAKHLLQAKASLKELLSAEDLKVLAIGKGSPQWAIGASQKNSDQDRFLSGLAITEWDVDQFVGLLSEKTSVKFRSISTPPHWSQGLDQEFMSWLAAKPVDWHQQFYSMLYRELASSSGLYQLKSLHIVRVSDGRYDVGSKCYFPSDDVVHDELLPRVDSGVYTSGKSKIQQEEAKKLLKELGVREVGEAEQVFAILKQRYTEKGFKPDMKDLERFVTLVENEPAQAKTFANFYILKLANGKWGKPSQVFLDLPYLDTGLSTYYNAINEETKKWALSDSYQSRSTSVSIERLGKFAEAVGAQISLEVTQTYCYGNPEWSRLSTVPGERATSPVNQDYIIKGLDQLLKAPTEELAKLVWRTMRRLPKLYLQARYQLNARHGSRYASSQLVHVLRQSAWVPQKNGQFVRPPEASRNQLPKGFPFDEGDEWLKAVRFGEEDRLRSEEHKKRQATAKELGFGDEETLADAQWFAALAPEERRRFKSEIEHRRQFELPENFPRNSEHRAERVGQQAAGAPERITEKRARSVSLGREEVKQAAKQYLRHQYTNTNGEMICQVCKGKVPLPFKLNDGS